MRQWGALLLLFLILSASPGGVSHGAPSSAEAYRIADIAVDETADDAVTAKAKALSAARRDAFQQLLQRLVPINTLARSTSPAAAEIEALILSVSLSHETIQQDGRRYRARVTVAFNPDAVRGLLRRRGVSYAETIAPPVLILPISTRSDGTPAPELPFWATVWTTLPLSAGLVPILLPAAEALTRPEALLARDIGALERSRRASVAGAEGVILALVASGGIATVQTLTVTLIPDAPSWTAFSWSRTFQAAPGESLGALAARAAQAALTALQEDWKRRLLVDDTAAVATLTVLIPLTRAVGWLDARRETAALPSVESVVLHRLSDESAEATLTYRGPLEQLQVALRRQGWSLFPQTDGPWLLTRFATPTETAPETLPGRWTSDPIGQ